jgi:hypothetical protein
MKKRTYTFGLVSIAGVVLAMTGCQQAPPPVSVGPSVTVTQTPDRDDDRRRRDEEDARRRADEDRAPSQTPDRSHPNDRDHKRPDDDGHR